MSSEVYRKTVGGLLAAVLGPLRATGKGVMRLLRRLVQIADRGLGSPYSPDKR